MKLYDGAVLLIIGTAVIGPIEPITTTTLDIGVALTHARCMDGKDLPDSYTNETWHQYTEAEISCGDDGRHAITETTAETCARAMKEIGARESEFDVVWAHQKPRWVVGHFASPKEVVCITAPSGLVK